MKFLDKFFKDNPWADQTQVESIVKATGLAESVIKVRPTRNPKATLTESTLSPSLFLLLPCRRTSINVARNGMPCTHPMLTRTIIRMTSSPLKTTSTRQQTHVSERLSMSFLATLFNGRFQRALLPLGILPSSELFHTSSSARYERSLAIEEQRVHCRLAV